MPIEDDLDVELLSNNILRVDNVRDANNTPATPINDATVTVELKDRNGVNIAGQVWPLTCDYIADSDGRYEGVLDESLGLPAGSGTVAYITVNAGANKIRTFRRNVRGVWA